jgi:L-rhamnose mutarotase
MTRIGLTVKINPQMIAEYKELHSKVWPAVQEQLKALGFRNLSIFHDENTLFLYQEYHGRIPIEKAYEEYAKNTSCQKWEQLMERFQEPGSGALAGVRWTPMQEVYHFSG